MLLIIIFWLMISPIPAALTMGVGNAANRAAVFMPALSIASALGALYIRNLFKSRYVFVFISLISLISLCNFLGEYINLSPANAARGMLYGNTEAALWLSQNSSDFERIIVSRSLSEPQIFIAFVNKWDPSNYQKSTKNWERYKDQNLKFLDQLSTYSLGRYIFKSIEQDDFLLENTLIVARPEEFKKDTLALEVIFYPDGSPSIYIVSTRQGGVDYEK